ncbi:MAG: Lrp/AsnC family transcriptional regulator [Pseudonocardiaceae bacterium]
MLTAIVLVQTVADRIPEVAQAIADLPGVTEVYSCAGKDVDIIVTVRVREPEQLAEVITGRLAKSHGVLNTNTYIAFRCHPTMDIQAGLSIGFDNLAIAGDRFPTVATKIP